MLLLAAPLLAAVATATTPDSASGSDAAAAASAAGPKNVLYILADDMRADWGTYGLPVHTPNLDKLATEALTFEHAFCQISVCSPSRQSFMTGLRPDTNKVWNFIDSNPASSQATPGHFRDTGKYLTLGLGKTFHEDNGAWNADAYWNTTVRPYFNYSNNDCPRGGEGGGHCTEPDHKIWDYHLRLASVDALNFAAEYYKNTSTPFFVMTGFRDPHAPWAAPQRMYDLYNQSAIALPEFKTLGQSTPLIAWSRELGVMLANGTHFPYSYDAPVPDWVQQDQRHAYYAAISYVDEHIGVLLGVLESHHIVEDTIVIMHADHGYSLGEHGYWEKKSNFDLTVRVPLMIKVPGVTDQPGYAHTTPALLDLVDMFPTVAALAGLDAPQHVDGVDQSSVVMNSRAASGGTEAFPRNTSYHQYPACGMHGVLNTTRQECNQVPADKFDFMGYSLRTLTDRYTAWFPWNTTALAPILGTEFAEELYSHAGDNSSNLDVWENVNLAASQPALAKQLHEQLLEFFFGHDAAVAALADGRHRPVHVPRPRRRPGDAAPSALQRAEPE